MSALNKARLASAPTSHIAAMWAAAHTMAAYASLLDPAFRAKLCDAKADLLDLLREREEAKEAPRDRTEVSPMALLSSRAEIP